MNRLQSAFSSSTGDLTSGRSRVYSVCTAGNYMNVVGSGLNKAPVIVLKNGSASGTTLMEVQSNPNSYDNINSYGSTNTLDLPSEGILFPDGVHVTVVSGVSGATIGVTVFFSGGAPA
jgi:hypothetical protein